MESEVDALYAKAAQDVSYFPGVENWFKLVQEALNVIVMDVKRTLDRSTEERVPDFEVHHYVISAGITEILNRISITDEFTSIFASQYWYGSERHAGLARALCQRHSENPVHFSHQQRQREPERRCESARPRARAADSLHQHDLLRRWHERRTRYVGGQGWWRARAWRCTMPKMEQDSKGAREGAALVKAGRADAVVPANYEKHSTLHTHVAVMMQEIVARSVVEAFAADKPLIQGRAPR